MKYDRKERRLNHIDDMFLGFGKELTEAGFDVYVPAFNPDSHIDFLIVTDGKSILYVDHVSGLGLRLSMPLVDTITGKLTSTMFGRYDPELKVYRQTPAETERVKVIFTMFRNQDWSSLLAGLPFRRPSQGFVASWEDYRNRASGLHDLTPIGRFLARKGPAVLKRVAIVGSRTFEDYTAMERFIRHICETENIIPSVIISGGARGADLLAVRFANEHGIKLMEYKPEWNKYGKSAGFKRNVEIIDDCDVCLAFWDGESKGTKHDIDLCKEKGKPCYIYRFR